MPNNTRIHNITDRIGDLWFSKVPNWRFGQMLSNFFSSLHTDPFYIDDNDLLKKLEQFLGGYNAQRIERKVNE